MKPILLLGGDGYVGWPLVLELASREPQRPLWLVDNGLRRRLVAEVGGNSVTPIGSLDERLAAARQRGLREIRALDLDVANADLDGLIQELRPGVVYHLAQQCSAPWSMMSPEQALFTLHNNEGGNLRLLWALRRHAPEAHLIKLGTFGEYAKGGIDVAEGYFVPEYQGRRANRPLPYPRESDDIYHITKINDSNFISLACRKWGLAITDIMQSTIYGVHTPRTQQDPALSTRFDYDAVWGTVVNRFIAQTVVGHPMTVYGTGRQRTGLMALSDSVCSLADLAGRPAERGQHRVINHVTERSWCVGEVAEQVAKVAVSLGYSPQIVRAHDPRGEQVLEKDTYTVEAHWVASCVGHTAFDQALPPLFSTVRDHADRVRAELFEPTVSWSG